MLLNGGHGEGSGIMHGAVAIATVGRKTASRVAAYFHRFGESVLRFDSGLRGA